MEAITDGNVLRPVFACRLISPPCNLLHKRHKGPPAEHWAVLIFASSLLSWFLNIFWCKHKCDILCSHDDYVAVDEAWAHPVFRDQSASGIRPRVKHKKQPHYIRITSVLSCIRPHKKQTHYICITSVLSCIGARVKHKKKLSTFVIQVLPHL